MRQSLCPIAAVALAAACSPDPEKPPPEKHPGDVRGTAVLSDGKPAADATVALEGSSWFLRTDAAGKFGFTGIAGGKYVLVAALDLGADRIVDAAARVAITVSSEDATELGNVVLSAPGEVVVTVVRGATPVAGAQVAIERFADARTGVDGKATFSKVPSGDQFAVAIVRDGESSVVSLGVPVKVTEGAKSEITIDLAGAQAPGTPRTPKLLVRVAGQADASGVEVSVYGPTRFSKTSEAEGIVEFEGATPGLYTVRARKAGLAPATIPFVVFGSETVRFEALTLAPQAGTCPLPGAVDSDADGTNDAQEAGCECDPQSTADADSDGVCNGPDPDDDNDGVPDAIDNCPAAANADQKDADGDGLGAACDSSDVDPNLDTDLDGVIDTIDNCDQDKNTDQLDTDADGQGDLCDEDDDGDLVLDVPDNCDVDKNPDQLDTDVDGEGDACDDDIDGDAALNTGDNCDFDKNPDQLDTDADGDGDACDDDIDGDARLNADDTCPLVKLGDHSDTDGDGFGAACDNCPLIDNDDQADADGNGVGDRCEPPPGAPAHRATICRGALCVPGPGATIGEIVAYDGVSRSDAWLVEAPSQLHHWNGQFWTTVKNPIEDDFVDGLGVTMNGLRVRSATDVDAWAMDAIVHWDGVAWAPVSLGAGAPVNASVFKRVERTVTHRFMLDDTGVVSWSDGTNFDTMSATAADLGETGGVVYAVTSTGKPARVVPFEAVFHLSEIGSPPLSGAEETRHVWALPSGVWFDVWDGTQVTSVLRYASGAWQRLPVAGLPTMVFGRSATQASILLENGGVRRFTAPSTISSFVDDPLPTTSPRGIFEVSGSELWFADQATLGAWKAGVAEFATPVSPTFAPVPPVSGGADGTYSLSATHVLKFDGNAFLPGTALPSGIDLADARIWAASPSDVWVTSGGRIHHWFGGSWTIVTGTPIVEGSFISIVKGSAANDVWFATTSGQAVHFDGVEFTDTPIAAIDIYPAGTRAWAVTTGNRINVWNAAQPGTWANVTPSGYSGTLKSVSGFGQSFIFVAGTRNSLSSTTGTASTGWTSRAMPAPGLDVPSGVDCVSAGECLLATSGGAMQFSSNTIAKTTVPSSSTFDTVVFETNLDYHFAGQAHLFHNDGGWRTLRASTLEGRTPRPLSAYATGAWAVIADDVSSATARWNGTSWQVFETDLARKITPTVISASSATEAWMAGPGGVARFSGNGWVSASTQATSGIYAAGGLDVVRVTTDGVTQWNGSSFTTIASVVSANVQRVDGFGNVMVLYGANKTLVERRAGTWIPTTDMPDCTGSAVPDGIQHVAVTGPNFADDLWVLGDCLRLRRGGVWSEVALPAAGNARRVLAVNNGPVWLEGARTVYFPANDTNVPSTELWMRSGSAWDGETMPYQGLAGEIGLQGSQIIVPLQGGLMLAPD